MATKTFNYTGAVQSWVVPSNVTSIIIECWGAAGTGHDDGFQSSVGGKGGYAKGTLTVTPGETLRAYVGGQTGYNGGGPKGVASGSAGGGTDVRQGGTALGNRKIVAGGGGAGGLPSDGGDGGAATGESGQSSTGGAGGGKGGTQSAGGAGGTAGTGAGRTGANGSLGQGGSGELGGDGGGGYYGGGEGGYNSGAAGGGGGSNYVGGVTSTTTTRGVRSGNGLVKFTYYYNPTQPGAFTGPVGGSTIVNSGTISHGASTDADGDLLGYDIDYSSNNGSSWSRILTGVTGTSRTYDFTQVAASATAKLRVRARDNGGRVSAWRESGTFSVIHNVAPNAPTLTAPTNNAALNRDITQRFTWSFSDPNPGDTQSKFDLRYRVSGTTTWTVITDTTTNKYWDAPAGTFAVDSYEWQVRTYDAVGAVGPYSSSRFFSAASVPTDLTITNPANNSTIPVEESQVAWSTPDQDAFQVRRVADDGAGAPDTTTIYYDSATVTSDTARSHALSFSVNNRDEHVQVRVQNDGLWSEWVSVHVTVSYTEPVTPTFTLTVDNDEAYIILDIVNPAPSGTEPTVIYNDIYRRPTNSTEDDWSHRATEVPANGQWIDREAEYGTEYYYKVVAQGDNNTSSESDPDWTTLRQQDWWLKDPYHHGFDRRIDVEMQTLPTNTPKDISFFNPLGRNNSVAVEGDFRSETVEIVIGTITENDYHEVLAILKTQRTILLQSPTIKGQWYVRVNSPIREEIINPEDPYVQFTVTFSEVDEPTTPRQAGIQ